MPRHIDIKLAPWCPNDCPYFEIGENKLYGDNVVMDAYYYCLNSTYCNYAVEKYKEFEKHREDIWKAVINTPYVMKEDGEINDGRGNEG